MFVHVFFLHMHIYKFICLFFCFLANWTKGGLSVPRVKFENKDEQYGKSSQRNCGTTSGKWHCLHVLLCKEKANLA